MVWTNVAPTTTPPLWNVTDIELLKRIQYYLLENGAADADGQTLITTMYTVAQWTSALNQAQEQFMKDTAPIVIRAQQGSTPGQQRYALPSDWIHTRRFTWQEQGGNTKALTRTDAFQMDNMLTDWQRDTGIPTVYNDGSNLPTLEVEIALAPSDIGTMTTHYVAQPSTLNGVSGSPVNLTVPDEFESGIFCLAMALLLEQEGECSDPERAAYCRMRYQFTVEMATILMEG